VDSKTDFEMLPLWSIGICVIFYLIILV